MSDAFVNQLRNFAAILITLSGIGHIAALWMRALDGAALLDACLGGVYLIIGIGLFGQSRFTLFMAMLIPATTAAFVVTTFPDLGQAHTARVAIDALVIFCSALVLWHVRNNPSV